VVNAQPLAAAFVPCGPARASGVLGVASARVTVIDAGVKDREMLLPRAGIARCVVTTRGMPAQLLAMCHDNLMTICRL